MSFLEFLKEEKFLSVMIGLIFSLIVFAGFAVVKGEKFRKKLFDECLKDGHESYVCYSHVKRGYR